MRAVPTLAVLVTAAAATGLVLAQSGGRPIPHEDLPALTGDTAQPTIGRQGSAGANPSAIAAGDKTLVKPSLDAKPTNPGEPVLGKGGFAADRQTSMKPDDNTGPDGTLQYVSVFNPDVLPFKRMTSFDAVGDDYTLHVARTVLTEIPVGGTTEPKARDRFWGDVLIQLKPGVDVPLPSVAPDMRILSYEVKPKIALKFSKDGADNFYVRSDESGASGQYRLVFYADADAGYFAPQLPPRKFRVRDVIANTPPELKNLIPQAVRREALVTLMKIGVDDGYDLGIAFNKLVHYFRAFQAGEIANPTGNIYRDLCDSQAGVCRHRSFAFMVTANALGIPTRYVQNEAHAFVEVWFPVRGWQRIDLGGAALRMNVTGADNKTLHRPRSDDPFAKPPEYKNQYTQLEGDIRGLTDQQKADKKKGLDQAPPSGAVGQQGTGGGSGAQPDQITPDPTRPVKPQDPKKATPDLVVTAADTSAYRGDFIHVEGVVRVDGKGLPNRRVDVFLAPAGSGGEGSIPVRSISRATRSCYPPRRMRTTTPR
jgi:transglutaminase-like putative cysteine protease